MEGRRVDGGESKSWISSVASGIWFIVDDEV